MQGYYDIKFTVRTNIEKYSERSREVIIKKIEYMCIGENQQDLLHKTWQCINHEQNAMKSKMNWINFSVIGENVSYSQMKTV